MCEPAHSIVQFPNDDDNRPGGSPAGHFGGTTETLLSKIKGSVGKLIGRWFHISRMGRGHSECWEATSSACWLLPEPTKYEAEWWCRSFHLDGPCYCPEWDRSEAIDSARQYANAVSIGSLTALRRFLETSLRLTSSRYYWYYIDRFCDMLTKEGRNAFRMKIRRSLGMRSTCFPHVRRLMEDSHEHLDKVVKTILGFTRKRELLVTEWADDTSLWVPGQ